jgi:DNA polymerase-3 subunit epsilon
MAKKFIILDTETTGLEVAKGHKIIEIGAVVLNDRKKSADNFHTYLNPGRLIDEEASKVHGINNEDLISEPMFAEIADDFIEFVQGSTLIIHNAPFDVGFLNSELKAVSSKHPKLEDICEIEDSLMLARAKFPGQRNSLDALANRFEVSGYDRSFHGALLDANILADVYIYLTGGQTKFEFSDNTSTSTNNNEPGANSSISMDGLNFIKILADKSDIAAHEIRLKEIEEKNNIQPLWKNHL